MHKIVRVEIVEDRNCWCLSALDSKGQRHQYNDLKVCIYPYDLPEKRLALAQERAAILAYEEGLQEYFIIRNCSASLKVEKVELEHSMISFADHMHLKQTDQAEMLLSGKLIRFAGWNGIRFERFNIVCSQEYSLDHSPIYIRIFTRDKAVFYRLKEA